MKQTEIDGVTVCWLAEPGALTARLNFGVGTRDEDLDTLGVTQLVQEFVLGRLSGTGTPSGPPSPTTGRAGWACSAGVAPRYELRTAQ